MEIKTYKDALEIPEEYLPSLVDAQIECWGQKPFDEYMICQNPECKALHSIEEVHGSVEIYREKVTDIVSFECGECNSGVEQIYNKKEFLEETLEYIKGEVSGVLLLDNEKVEGFTVMSKTNVGGLVNYEFATRNGSYDKDLLSKNISNIVFGSENSMQEELIHWNHIYLSSQFRKMNLSFEFAKQIFFLNEKYKNFPLIAETRFDSKIYPVLREIGFIEIMRDDYGYVCLFLQEFNQMLEYLKENSAFKGKRKFYK